MRPRVGEAEIRDGRMSSPRCSSTGFPGRSGRRGQTKDVEQALTLPTGVEPEGVGKHGGLVGPDALKASREVVDERLGEQDMADETVDPGSRAEWERIESRELLPERLLDRRKEMPH